MNDYKLEKICNFLKPGKIEYVIYGGSTPVSVFIAVATYLISHDALYTALSAFSPQILEYSVLRIIETGRFGEYPKNLIHRMKI